MVIAASHGGNGYLSLRVQEQPSQGMRAFALDELVPGFGRRQRRIHRVVEDEIASSRADGQNGVSLARVIDPTVATGRAVP